jgi:DNA-directed RNA polymerase specialized sigma24 family protein
MERAARRERRVAGEHGEATQATNFDEPDLLAQTLCGRMTKLLAQLPYEQQTVIIECYVEGKSQRDIATAQCVPLGTIKSGARLKFQAPKATNSGAHIIPQQHSGSGWLMDYACSH